MFRSLLAAVIGLLLSGGVVVVCLTPTMQESAEHLIEALSESHGFEDWSASFISTNSLLHGALLPSTLFVPSSSSDFHDGGNKKIRAAYHIIPEKLDFFTLCLKINGSRLLTLLSGESVTLLNTSYGLMVNNVLHTEPDLFVDAVMAIHRIASPLHPSKSGAGQDSAAGLIGLILSISLLLICVMLLVKSFLPSCKSD